MRRCPLREVLIQSNVGILLPSSPNTHFGTIAHQLLAKAGRGRIPSIDMIESEWETLVASLEKRLIDSKLERHLVPIENVLQRYEVRKKVLFKTAAKLMPRGDYSPSSISVSAERWVETSDKILGGYIDRVTFINGKYEIIDFKTGTILVPGTTDVKEEYKYQMMLYAVIMFENLGTWPISLKLKKLDQDFYEIPFKTQDCLELKEQASQLFKGVNDIIKQANGIEELQYVLANPTVENCLYCGFRPVCNPYWKKKGAFVKNEKFSDIRGKLVSLQLLGNGTYLIKIQDLKTTYRVRGINLHRYQIAVGDYVSIYNLHPDRVENCFSEGILTTVYTYY
ncbi:TPA: PD-(D/E)XK nuclease family protein [Bacillus toyonensis]|nr:PD-(D/E)XK nuclease family protein [Bacillus toyonensis]